MTIFFITVLSDLIAMSIYHKIPSIRTSLVVTYMVMKDYSKSGLIFR